MRPPLPILAFAVVAAVLLLAAGSARGEPNPRECIAAADRGQLLQKSHNLILAREVFRVCAASTCPAEVQRACIGWLDAADKAQPTLAFAVTSPTGEDITNVTVTVDGLPFVSKVMGTAVEIDPGEHSFRFVAAGYVSLTRKVVIIEGDKTRRVQVILEPVGGTPAVAGTAARRPLGPAIEPQVESTAPVEHSTGQKTAGVILLAAGGASIGTGIGFLIDYVINKTNYSSDAANNNFGTGSSKVISDPCHTPTATTPGTNDGCAAEKNAQIAEIVQIATFTTGGVLSIIGISLIATAPAPYERRTATTWLDHLEVVPSVAPGQGSVLLRGRF